MCVCLQNMDKWAGGRSDEWVYLTGRGDWSPTRKAQLAFYLEIGRLPSQCLVRHASEASTLPHRNLGKTVEQWRADCLHDHGQWGHVVLSVLHCVCLSALQVSIASRCQLMAFPGQKSSSIHGAKLIRMSLPELTCQPSMLLIAVLIVQHLLRWCG